MASLADGCDPSIVKQTNRDKNPTQHRFPSPFFSYGKNSPSNPPCLRHGFGYVLRTNIIFPVTTSRRAEPSTVIVSVRRAVKRFVNEKGKWLIVNLSEVLCPCDRLLGTCVNIMRTCLNPSGLSLTTSLYLKKSNICQLLIYNIPLEL